LAGRAVEDYLRRLSVAHSPSDAPRLSKAEAQLLQEINRGLPEVTWRRYHELIAQRRAGTLTDDEFDELKRLTDTVEVTHARRMEKLAELARVRQISLDELMAELGLQDPGYV
jgi:hypothetical protein